MRPIPENAVDFTTEHEGLRLKAYPDPASGGDPWTIGYGHTGPEVRPGMTISQAQAKAYLRQDLRTAASRIYSRIGTVADELTDNQYAALLSFVFNVGANPSWTIWKVLKARQFDQVPAQLMRFVNAAGKRMKGLVNRRTAECALWASDDAGDDVLPSSVTRSTPTPPTPTDSKPLLRSKSFMTTAATGGTAASAGVN